MCIKINKPKGIFVFSSVNILRNKLANGQHRHLIKSKSFYFLLFKSRQIRRSVCAATSHRKPSPKWTFVFDPAGRLCYYWSMVVSLAFLYNFWVIIYRFAFQEINGETLLVWFCLDYFSDFLYLIDILFHFRTGYLEDGVLQTDSTKLRQHYMNSTTFYIDCLCLLPLDFLYLSIGFNSILRSCRLVKIYRFWAFMDRTERHTNYPNLFRSTSLIHYLLVIFHWNGCLYHIINKNNGFGSKNWVYNDSESADVVKQYLQSYYWCTLALTTIGDLPRPRSKSEYVFVICQLLFGLMLFATVLGHVANIVTSVSAARKEFQGKNLIKSRNLLDFHIISTFHSQQNSTAWKHTCECEECQIIFKWKSSNGLIISGLRKSVPMKREPYHVFPTSSRYEESSQKVLKVLSNIDDLIEKLANFIFTCFTGWNSYKCSPRHTQASGNIPKYRSWLSMRARFEIAASSILARRLHLQKRYIFDFNSDD